MRPKINVILGRPDPRISAYWGNSRPNGRERMNPNVGAGETRPTAHPLVELAEQANLVALAA